MSEVWALMWDIKAGSEDEVDRLFRESGQPDYTIRDEQRNEKGRLLATTVFRKDRTIVRVIEFEGVTLPEVARHMGQQEEVVQLERALDPHLAEPRDLSNPDRAREFFARSSMHCILSRRHDR